MAKPAPAATYRKISTILQKRLTAAHHSHNFGSMVELEWVRLSAETLYYCHDQYLLKKKKVRNYFVYTIWQNGELKFYTYNEYEFASIVKKIISNLAAGSLSGL